MFNPSGRFGRFSKARRKSSSRDRRASRRTASFESITLGLESLEDRLLLAITATLTGSQVQFTGDSNSDNLRLRVDSGLLEFSVDQGNTYQQDLDTSQPGVQSAEISALTSITVNLTGTGGDELSLDPTILSAGVPLTYQGSPSGSIQSLAGSNDPTDTWNITGPGAGTLDGIVTFSQIGQVYGGQGNTTFLIEPFSGGSNLTLAGGTAATTAITSLGQSGGTADSWQVTGANAGTLNGDITFSNVGEIVGGNNTSTFSIQPFTGGSNLSLFGGTGTSTLDYSAFTTAINVDLTQGTATNLGFVTGVENVTGGSGNDTITGDDQNNFINGGAGDNTLSGGGGDDTFAFSGSWGTDVVSGDTTDSGGTDTLDFSAVPSNLNVAVNADDSLNITSNSGTVMASGTDAIIGGSGSNTLDYSAYSKGVTVDLLHGVANDFTSISGFENVIGSNYDDTIIGDANANSLDGGGGDDTITGGGGNDTINGGAGTNTLVESLDASFKLTNSSLTVTPYGSATSYVETIANIQHASLTGGIDSNKIDASAFTLGGVTLNGGSDIPLWRSTAATAFAHTIRMTSRSA